MQIYNIVDAIALQLCAEKPFTQTEIARRMNERHIPLRSESAYKRAVTRLHQLGLISLAQDEPARQGNTKYYEITAAGKDELECLEKCFIAVDRDENTDADEI
jgi:DNA-binding PadR family transcriptional regulator